MRPVRETIRKEASGAAYFVSTQTASRRPFFRHERWARLMVATLTHYAKKDFLLHAYVIMPDHLHLLISPSETLEKSVQLIKGGFSFRAKRELDWKFDIWQPGFTDHRIRGEEDWKRHLEYIRSNPIEARLVEDAVLYEFMGFPEIAFPQGLKPRGIDAADVRPKGRTLQSIDLQDKGQTLQMRRMDVQGEGRNVQMRGRDAQGEGSTLRPQLGIKSNQGAVKGTGFSPSENASSLTGALAPEGGKRCIVLKFHATDQPFEFCPPK